MNKQLSDFFTTESTENTESRERKFLTETGWAGSGRICRIFAKFY
jgi:hypothetical protein